MTILREEMKVKKKKIDSSFGEYSGPVFFNRPRRELPLSKCPLRIFLAIFRVFCWCYKREIWNILIPFSLRSAPRGRLCKISILKSVLIIYKIFYNIYNYKL